MSCRMQHVRMVVANKGKEDLIRKLNGEVSEKEDEMTEKEDLIRKLNSEVSEKEDK